MMRASAPLELACQGGEKIPGRVGYKSGAHRTSLYLDNVTFAKGNIDLAIQHYRGVPVDTYCGEFRGQASSGDSSLSLLPELPGTTTLANRAMGSIYPNSYPKSIIKQLSPELLTE